MLCQLKEMANIKYPSLTLGFLFLFFNGRGFLFVLIFLSQAFIRLLFLFRDDLRTDFTQRQVGSVRQQPEQVRLPFKEQYREMI